MNWDLNSKLLLKACPQDFISYLVPGARYVGMRETQFQTSIESPYDVREMRGDWLAEVELQGRHFLIGIELQSSRDGKMDERLLGYSYEATRQHNMLVLSCVIYVKKVRNVPQPPLDRVLPNDYRSVWFNYKSVELAEQSVDEIRQHKLDGLWPLMLLCKDGATHEVLEEVLQHLKKKNKGNLIWITEFYADMVFTSAEDRVYLRRRFAMAEEESWENSWYYKEFVQKRIDRGIELGIAEKVEQRTRGLLQEGLEQGIEQGRQQGMEQGRQQGMEQGRQQGMVDTIEAVVQVRFPDLLGEVKKLVEPLDDLARLREISLLVSTARTVEEVKQNWTDLP